MKCGITGFAQINGFRCSNTSIQKRIEQDLYYMQNWSLLLDLNIIFKTVLSRLGHKNAYKVCEADRNSTREPVAQLIRSSRTRT